MNVVYDWKQNHVFSFKRDINVVVSLQKEKAVIINHHRIAMTTAMIGQRSECGESFRILTEQSFSRQIPDLHFFAPSPSWWNIDLGLKSRFCQFLHLT